MRNDTTSIQVLSFIALTFCILFLYKFYIDTFERSNNININPNYPSSNTKIDHSHDKIRCPPEELIKKQEPTILKHTNDLNIVNEKINLYDGQNISTYGFENELGNDTTISKEFSPELEEMYEHQPLPQYKNYNTQVIKPNKSDLPIVNVPYYLLKDDQPLRLSERPLL